MRQIVGAFAELEKARLVAKLGGARERKRAEEGKCEGRKSLAERSPELAAAARAFNDGRSLRKIADALAEQGFVTPSGKVYAPSAVKGMLVSEGSKSHALKRTDAKGAASSRPRKKLATSYAARGLISTLYPRLWILATRRLIWLGLARRWK